MTSSTAATWAGSKEGFTAIQIYWADPRFQIKEAGAGLLSAPACGLCLLGHIPQPAVDRGQIPSPGPLAQKRIW